MLDPVFERASHGVCDADYLFLIFSLQAWAQITGWLWHDV